MNATKILHELTHTKGLPKEALEAATAQRDEMLPLFVQEIGNYLALGPAARAKPTPLFFIFHLLGEWREKAAYRPLARLLRLPPRRSIRSSGTVLPRPATASWRYSMATLSRYTRLF
jgi:hypothetical protein